MSGPLTLEQLAHQLEGRLVASADRELQVTGIRVLDRASAGDLSFVHGKKYLKDAAESSAGAFLVAETVADSAAVLERPLIVVGDTHLAVARAIRAFHPKQWPAAGRHETAVVGEGCDIHPSAHIGPYVVIGDGSRIGAGAVLEAHVVIGRNCGVGDTAWLHPGVVLYDDTLLGERVEIHSGAVIGADGFGYATSRGTHHKVPQVGRAVLEDDVEVGANSAVDRAVLEDTRIGAGTKIDNLVQVGHNVETGRSCILCGQVGIAGSAKLEDHVVLGGHVGVIGHLTVGAGVQAASKAAIYEDIPAGTQLGGIPGVPLMKYRRQVALIGKLDTMARRLRRLERQVEKLGASDGAASDAPEGSVGDSSDA